MPMFLTKSHQIFAERFLNHFRLFLPFYDNWCGFCFFVVVVAKFDFRH